jgi:chromosome segregation ATPase
MLFHISRFWYLSLIKLGVIATALAKTGDEVREKFLAAESDYNYLTGRVNTLSSQIQSLEYETASENVVDVPAIKEEIRGLTTKLETVKKAETEKQTALNAARTKLREVQKLANDEALVHQKKNASNCG